MPPLRWYIPREGRAWSSDEVWPPYSLSPEKMELTEGKLFWTDEDRLNMLGLLLENLGADKAVRLGSREVWREAIAQLEEE